VSRIWTSYASFSVPNWFVLWAYRAGFSIIKWIIFWAKTDIIYCIESHSSPAFQASACIFIPSRGQITGDASIILQIRFVCWTCAFQPVRIKDISFGAACQSDSLLLVNFESESGCKKTQTEKRQVDDLLWHMKYMNFNLNSKRIYNCCYIAKLILKYENYSSI
jgi:hypothetical protein